MKIDDKDVLSSSLQNVSKVGTASNSARTAASSEKGAASSEDAVDLNSHTRILAGGIEASESARAARIQELREIYVNGRQQVDSRELSNAIIDAHLGGD